MEFSSRANDTSGAFERKINKRLSKAHTANVTVINVRLV